MTTILVTDIVGSTSTLERVGDQAGGELLAAHERMTRDELVLHGGDEINMVGDGFFASFASPARAIRCALAIVSRVRDLGIVIRAGIHTGELERIGGTPRGIAMHVAARIASRAAPGEVLVSATTRELAAGAGLEFTDRGEHRLKGVADPRRLFAAFEDRRESSLRPVSQASAETARACGVPRRTDGPRGRRTATRRSRAVRRRRGQAALRQRTDRQRTSPLDLPQGRCAITCGGESLRRGARLALTRACTRWSDAQGCRPIDVPRCL